jgi:hypothetical protein
MTDSIHCEVMTAAFKTILCFVTIDYYSISLHSLCFNLGILQNTGPIFFATERSVRSKRDDESQTGKDSDGGIPDLFHVIFTIVVLCDMASVTESELYQKY